MGNETQLWAATGPEEPLSDHDFEVEMQSAQVRIDNAIAKGRRNEVELNPIAVAQAQTTFRLQALINALVHMGIISARDMQVEYARVQSHFFEDSIDQAVQMKVAQTLMVPAHARQKIVTAR